MTSRNLVDNNVDQIDATQIIRMEPEARSTYKQMKRESVAELEKGEITATNISW